jgi:hypothetical protein
MSCGILHPMAQHVEWRDSNIYVPNPHYVPTYYPALSVDPKIKDVVTKLGGEGLISAYGYGSSFIGDAAPDSILDLLLITKDPRAFHEANLSARPRDYGHPHWAGFHAALNRYGFNFYKTNLDIDGEKRKAKYGVIGYKDFRLHTHGARKDSLQGIRGRGRLYVAGRMQKAMLAPIKVTDGGYQTVVDAGINQARLDGIWLSLGLMDDIFSFDDLARTYVGLSYKADARIEHPDKVKNIYTKGQSEYHEMLEPLLDQFQKRGVLQKISIDSYAKLVSLSRSDVKIFLWRSKLDAAAKNYFKNPLTFGLGRGIGYAVSKVKRSLRK